MPKSVLAQKVENAVKKAIFKQKFLLPNIALTLPKRFI
jgi:hypothetical protein